jgi:hypothetical protein
MDTKRSGRNLSRTPVVTSTMASPDIWSKNREKYGFIMAL